MKSDWIKIYGAREHNLKNINIALPKYKMVVVTGLSGSGKSSLAFDTIYAEGQRRYVESLSAYARQFLEQMDKPDVDKIEGLSPTIAIQQHTHSKNPRSTVGTITEIYDYLRLLFAKIGKARCVACGHEIKSWSPQAIAKVVMAKYAGTKISVFSPLIRGRIGTYEELFGHLKKKGFIKVMIDSRLYELSAPQKLERYKKHDIELFIDEFTLSNSDAERLIEAIELALNESKGYIKVLSNTNGKGETFSTHNSCPGCGISFPELEPRLFSFNSPYGACPKCSGLGVKIEISPQLVIPDEDKSIEEGAIHPWANPITTRTHRWKNSWNSYYFELLENVCAAKKIPMNIPWKKLSRSQKESILYGTEDFEGIIPNLRRRRENTKSEFVKEEIDRRYTREVICQACEGKRLKPESLSVFVAARNIFQVSQMAITDLYKFINSLSLTEKEKVISQQIIKEIKSRLEFLISVGIGYISPGRRADTLAGGEAQRIQLATQIGSRLTGVIYVLDEPTIGLHQKDNAKLVRTLKSLRDLGNTLIIVEHDEEIIRNADFIIDLGPLAGLEGGKVVASGEIDKILSCKNSLTGQFLRKAKRVARPAEKDRKPYGFLEFSKAEQFNLKRIDVKIPLGLLTSICGVSGSGKSTLLYEIIYKALAKKLHNLKDEPGKFKSMSGANKIDKVIIVDQSPIGRTPRSNPATYTGVFGYIRDVFASLPESRRRGYKAGRFSFNLPGGRCEACKGDGTIKIQMQFLPDVYVKCEECKGRRFNDTTLEIKFKGKSISEILDMPVSNVMEIFADIPPIKRILQTLCDVGLEYIKLGQSATTLSGGEAQRMKLARQLSKKSTGKTLYILDEPTTGLHFADVEKLLLVLLKLTGQGNTVLIIEHNLDIISSSDWIIELGPEGGDKGGEVIFAGRAKDILNSKTSVTAPYLKKYFADKKVH